MNYYNCVTKSLVVVAAVVIFRALIIALTLVAWLVPIAPEYEAGAQNFRLFRWSVWEANVLGIVTTVLVFCALIVALASVTRLIRHTPECGARARGLARVVCFTFTRILEVVAAVVILLAVGGALAYVVGLVRPRAPESGAGSRILMHVWLGVLHVAVHDLRMWRWVMLCARMVRGSTRDSCDHCVLLHL